LSWQKIVDSLEDVILFPKATEIPGTEICQAHCCLKRLPRLKKKISVLEKLNLVIKLQVSTEIFKNAME